MKLFAAAAAAAARWTFSFSRQRLASTAKEEEESAATCVVEVCGYRVREGNEREGEAKCEKVCSEKNER